MILAGSGGLYELLLIVLVVVLIFNGLKRQKIMNKVHDNLTENKKSTIHKKHLDENSEYVDFEEIKDN